VALLESGGAVCSPGTEDCTPSSPEVARVPRFEGDGRTEIGTGFRELTADGRLSYSFAPGQRLVAATYLYRQFDAPRTDQCPPPFASLRECLVYDEQFRTLAYLGYTSLQGPRWARSVQTTVSFQRQHELRTRHRPQSFIDNGGSDQVTTVGTLARLRTDTLELSPWLGASLGYGADLYADTLDSAAWTDFTDNDVLVPATRGQYLDGSSYQQGGAYLDLESRWFERVAVRLGGRLGWARAVAPEDPASGTLAVDAAWPTVAAHAGLEVTIIPGLSLLGNVDRSFRAPNLDDLTSRQQAGPGFQVENAALGPETSATFEAGLRADVEQVLEADAWIYRSVLYDAIVRSVIGIGDCPPATPSCAASWSRYKLVNLGDAATIDGFELSARGWLPLGFSLRATLAYAYGEGPNPQAPPVDPAAPYEPTVPLSRIPPLNGTAEARWDSTFGPYLGAGVRWAATQSRLAISDRSDARIPLGGTPGFAVLDLRAGYRYQDNVLVSLLLENVLDTAYRYHGSSINGPGRGLIVHVEGGL
jgi:outer membrane receptor protein involved in Fe transport